MSETGQVKTSEEGAQTAGYASFADFVEKQRYRYAPKLSDAVPQQDIDARSGLDQDRILALSVAKHLDDLKDDSVAVNRTIDSAVVVLAEQDEADSRAGKLHYIAFLSNKSETYLFTENIKIGPDGAVTSTMEGRKWEMGDNDERNAFEKLADKFGRSAAEKPSPFQNFAKAASVPLGGEESVVGQYEIEKTENSENSAALSSGAEVNETTGVMIGSEYTRSGPSHLSLKVFRANAQGVMEEAAKAAVDGPKDPERYDAYSRMQPGINVFKP